LRAVEKELWPIQLTEDVGTLEFSFPALNTIAMGSQSRSTRSKSFAWALTTIRQLYERSKPHSRLKELTRVASTESTVRKQQPQSPRFNVSGVWLSMVKLDQRPQQRSKSNCKRDQENHYASQKIRSVKRQGC